MIYKYVKQAIVSAGGMPNRIPAADRKSLMERWRHTYSQEVKRRTGEWIHDNLDWHTFSWEYCAAKSGAEALESYREVTSTEVIVIPEFDSIYAYTCTGCSPPDFSDMTMDLYVFDTSLDWTMAFTHEQPDFGPYFSCRDWAAKSTT